MHPRTKRRRHGFENTRIKFLASTLSGNDFMEYHGVPTTRSFIEVNASFPILLSFAGALLSLNGSSPNLTGVKTNYVLIKVTTPCWWYFLETDHRV